MASMSRRPTELTFFVPSFRQDDGVERCAIIANALWPFLWDRMALQIIGCEVRYGRSFSGNFAGFGGIFAAHRIREKGACLLFRLFECEQRAMSTVLAGVSQDVAHKVHPATLPRGMQHLGDSRL